MSPETIHFARILGLLAIATPIIAIAIWTTASHAAEASQQPLPGRFNTKLLLLGLSGPISLLLWWIQETTSLGLKDEAGYLIAALIFIAAGYATGWLGRRKAD